MQFWLRRPSPHLVAFLAFFVWYLLLVHDVRNWSHRDPSSAFFDPERAFERKYSLEREAEAESYVARLDGSYSQQSVVKGSAESSFCIGVPTIQRDGARYFRRTLGSVLAGLTPAERKDIYLVSLIANSDPTMHVAFGEHWLSLAADEVLTYPNASEGVLERVKSLETFDPKFDRKPLFDYTYLLRHCYNHGAPWIVMLEDDVIGAEGWYYRTKQALGTLEGLRPFNSTLYLRLFYNERILGWNSEEWPTYFMRVLMAEAIVFAAIMLGLFFIPNATAIFDPTTVFTLLFVVTPMFIVLYFAAGRRTVSPLAYGLNRMDAYGCCSQAFVFPRQQLPELMAYYESAGSGKMDQLTEKYADEHSLARWALTPSVFAHVGSTSSKQTSVSRWGRSNTENIWNFAFETFDREKLKDEHM
ncbi:integral membrane protein [Neohortaea acidophila]|uniref:Integral membrane protein n=1 Tax=Neohortaea acidophila TaxID=245834 RepID=A0A6A6Q8P4_9PEZI|nr:uncharacterized protein BDY17DRAFT_314794 [Neohortaea acidophila]KAF2488013.1 integral membrane protein [Neohortaea acidophila]